MSRDFNEAISDWAQKRIAKRQERRDRRALFMIAAVQQSFLNSRPALTVQP
jgi:hypothetical protein